MAVSIGGRLRAAQWRKSMCACQCRIANALTTMKTPMCTANRIEAQIGLASNRT